VTTFLTTRQALELGRLADRCGPLAVRQLAGGCIAVGIATTPEPIATVAVALDGNGRVAAHRRLRRQTPMRGAA
jgi:hypothetical protein